MHASCAVCFNHLPDKVIAAGTNSNSTCSCKPSMFLGAWVTLQTVHCVIYVANERQEEQTRPTLKLKITDNT